MAACIKGITLDRVPQKQGRFDACPKLSSHLRAAKRSLITFSLKG
jgi:hypothetical protein